MKIIFCALFVALFVATAWAQQTIFNNADLITSSSPGGTYCSHASSYDFVGSSRGAFYVGFPTSGVAYPVTSAKFFIKPARCVNSQTQTVWVRTIDNPAATFNEVGGINNQCPFLGTKEPTVLATFNDQTCISQAIDVTDALNAAIQANNHQFVLSLSSSSIRDAENPNFCNRFVTPNVEPHYNDNSNCGLKIVSRESFYIVVENNGPTTALPSFTTAPPEQRPSDCWTCPSGFVHYTLVPNAPRDDRCGCANPNIVYTSAAPTEYDTRGCWTCPAGYTHWFQAGLTSAPGNDRCACVPKTQSTTTTTASPTYDTRGCWTCAPGWTHWFQAGLTSAPGGDRCACVPTTRRLSTVKNLNK